MDLFHGIGNRLSLERWTFMVLAVTVALATVAAQLCFFGNQDFSFWRSADFSPRAKKRSSLAVSASQAGYKPALRGQNEHRCLGTEQFAESAASSSSHRAGFCFAAVSVVRSVSARTSANSRFTARE